MATVNSTKDKLAKLSPLQTMEKAFKTNIAGLAQALPKHMKPERMTRIVMSLLRTSPALQECQPITIMAAVFQMAQLGLEPLDGQAYIIPYMNKGIRQAQFQIGYKGLVSLFYRHERSVSLDWAAVHENDLFSFDKGKGELSHKPNLKDDRGAVYAYWVKAKLANGAEIFEVMSRGEIEKHAKQHSRAYAAGPWQTDFDSMALKTVLKKLMKLLPKSIEIQRALAMDETTKTKVEEDMATVPDETDWGENGNGKPTIDVPGETIPGAINMDDYQTDAKTGKLVHKQTGLPL